jgi:hypothetical protein
MHASEVAAATGNVLSNTMKELDEKFGIFGYFGFARGKAQELDQKVTGGKISPAIISAYNMGLVAAGHVHDRYEETKRELRGASSTDKPSTP